MTAHAFAEQTPQAREPERNSANRNGFRQQPPERPVYVQKKMRMSASGDPLEDEADQIADFVLAGIPTTTRTRSEAPGVQRQESEQKPTESVPKFGVEDTPQEKQDKAIKEAAATLGSYLWDLFAASDVGQHVLAQNKNDMKRVIQFFRDAAGSLAGKAIIAGAAAGAVGAAWGQREAPAKGSPESLLPKDDKYFGLELKWDFVTPPAALTLQTPWAKSPELTLGKKAPPKSAPAPPALRFSEKVPRICTPADPNGDQGQADAQSAFIFWWLLRNRQMAEDRLRQIIQAPQLKAPKYAPSVFKPMFKRTGAGAGTQEADPTAVAAGLGSSDQPLDHSTRTFMESRFRQDFTHVRVHSDKVAAASAAALGAEAYTHGRHVVFGQGRYTPATTEGRRLLAHELAHVVQQQGRGPLASPVMRRGRTVGGFFANALQFWDYSKSSLDQYLQTLKATNQIEGDDDSDDKARQVVADWAANKNKFSLTPRIKVLLVREMLDGTVSSADQQGIMDLLEGSPGADLTAMFTEITPAEIANRFSSQKARFQLFQKRVLQTLGDFGPLDPADQKSLEAGLEQLGAPLGAEFTDLYVSFNIPARVLYKSFEADIFIPPGGLQVDIKLTRARLSVSLHPGISIDVVGPFDNLTLMGFDLALRGLDLQLNIAGNDLLTGAIEGKVKDSLKSLLVGTRFADPTYDPVKDPQLVGEVTHQDRVGDLNRIKYNFERMQLAAGGAEKAAGGADGKKDDKEDPSKVGLKDLSQFTFAVGAKKTTKFEYALGRGFDIAIEPDTKFSIAVQVAANAEQLKNKDAQLVDLHISSDGVLFRKNGKKIAALKSLHLLPGPKITLDEVDTFVDLGELLREEFPGDEWYSKLARLVSHAPDDAIKGLILWLGEKGLTIGLQRAVASPATRNLIKGGAGVSDEQIDRFFGVR